MWHCIIFVLIGPSWSRFYVNGFPAPIPPRCMIPRVSLRFPFSLLAANMALHSGAFDPTQVDDPSPDYHASVVRSNSAATGSSTAASSTWSGSYEDSLRSPTSINVEPVNGKPVKGKYIFRLSLKVDKSERPLGDPTILNLSVDPRKLEFVVFVFPGKSTIPAGCLWSYRVWLRVNFVDHRIFGDDELWVGKDPEFSAITDASFARLTTVNANSQVYDGVVGRARVQFIVKWTHLAEGLYKYTIEYESAGVGASLVEDFRLTVHGDPRSVSFLIYTVPMSSMPAGASHRIRVWLKTLLPFPDQDNQSSNISLPFNDSYIYQRIWKSDSLKLGARLDFFALGTKMIMGYSNGPPKTFTVSHIRDRDRFDTRGTIEFG
ncbi:hypothetical protein D9757_001117 [Collybiopsis confluens]|uniref:Uncharacterized protein n=1 Tax=Collybiopsis confluens TaxID=2823264 RepID=A0A8H5I108_9AGAR|nr:hypothetical protein D9757_001117 [Collybiopsis confluens]